MATILVVDDELGIRDLLFEILNDEGHQVELAMNAAEARDKADKLVVDHLLGPGGYENSAQLPPDQRAKLIDNAHKMAQIEGVKSWIWRPGIIDANGVLGRYVLGRVELDFPKD
jgi:CheY-like chemotaxis protein